MAEQQSDKLDAATLRHAAGIAAGLVRHGEAGEIEETLLRLAASIPAPLPELQRIRIPTNTMEQEFARHYDRGFAAGVASVSTSGHRIDLGSFVNAANISAADVPHIVVEKLQKAMDAANVLGVRSASGRRAD